MKNLFVVIVIFFLTSCGSRSDRSDREYRYNITYTDGTEELIVVNDKIDFVGDNGCVETCGCTGGKTQRCGVRNFVMVEALYVNESDSIDTHKKVNLKN